MGRAECNGEGRTRDVLRKELSPDFLSFGAAVCVWVPNRSHEKVCVVSWVDVHIFCNGLAHDGFVHQDVNVEVGHSGRIIGGVGNVDVCLQGDGGASRVDDGKVSNLGS